VCGVDLPESGPVLCNGRYALLFKRYAIHKTEAAPAYSD
jgi:hypothetical protein